MPTFAATGAAGSELNRIRRSRHLSKWAPVGARDVLRRAPPVAECLRRKYSGQKKGQTVSTSDLNQRNLPYYVDFRAVFGSVIKDWLGFNPDPVFKLGGEDYDPAIGGALFA